MLHPDLQNQNGPTPLTPAPRLIAGKYVSVEEAEKGLEHLQSTLTERNRRIAELEAKVNTANTPNYQEELGGIGVPPEAVEAAAASVFERMFQPYIQGQAARESAHQRHQVLATNEQAVVQFLEANPEKLAQFQQAWRSGLYDMAYDWAASEYERAASQAPPPPQFPTNRMDGFMPPPGSGRMIENQLASREQRAQQEFLQTGRPASLIKARLESSRQAGHFQRGVYGS